jgi:hypothetical protein
VVAPFAHLHLKVLRRPLEFALHPAIGMMNQSAEILVPAHEYRHLQRVERDLGTQMVRNLPPDNPAGKQVHDKRGIHPAGPRVHIGNVRHPPPVRRGRMEVPIQQVRRTIRGITRQCRRWPLPPAPGAADSHFPHQPLHREPRYRNAVSIQQQPHFPRPEHLTASPARPHLHYLNFHDRIADFPRRGFRLALLRIVIRRDREFHNRADRLDTEPVTVLINELN